MPGYLLALSILRELVGQLLLFLRQIGIEFLIDLRLLIQKVRHPCAIIPCSDIVLQKIRMRQSVKTVEHNGFFAEDGVVTLDGLEG